MYIDYWICVLYLEKAYTRSKEGSAKTLILSSIMNIILLPASSLQEIVIGSIDVVQAALQSTGIDWLLWPIFLIVAWWILLARTNTILKIFAVPAIGISTYFFLFILYKFTI